MVRRYIPALVFVTASCLWGGVSSAQNAAPAGAEVRASRLDAVKALLVALKRLNDEAKGGKDREIEGIETGLREAAQLAGAGNDGAAGELIDRLYLQTRSALASMQKGPALKSGSAALAESKQDAASEADLNLQKSIFARREASVAALLAAGSRVATEKSTQRAELQAAEAQLATARSLAQQGSFKAAIAQIDQAYQQAKAGVFGLRNGDVLTADKHFATPADEFRYEQTRNDDYQNLAAALLENAADASWLDMARKGRALRADSEAAARSGQWSPALQQIGQSTQQFKNLLRSAGFPIM